MIGLQNHVAPPQPHPNLEKMAEQCDKLKNELSLMQNELSDFVEIALSSKFLDPVAFGNVKDIYEEKISKTTIELQDIIENLRNHGYDYQI